ncbi:MAG: Uma2 family endonuclease [Bryobacteraceae bacterium]|nr:Uma2 family endonuclease [Bryobacteraceae bacterium]
MVAATILPTEEILLSFRLPELSDDQFFDMCAENGELRIERSANGEVTIMPGTGWETGDRNAELTYQVRLWTKTDRRGRVGDSGTMFRIPNGAMRSPDVGWVRRERLESVSPEQRKRFLPLCPDFVIELTSPSDRLREVRRKMEEWMENGCQFGLLVHPPKREVHIYRPTGVEIVTNPDEVRCEAPVDGLVLDLKPVWDLGW